MTTTTTDLEDLLRAQRASQVLLGLAKGAGDPMDMGPFEAVDYMKTMVHALQSELAEFMNELPWKTWAPDMPFNPDAALGELVDAFKFFGNLLLAIGGQLGLEDTQDLAAAFVAKFDGKTKVVHDRAGSGYDGKTGKCDCSRALEDGAETAGFVKCACGQLWQTPGTDGLWSRVGTRR